MERLLAIISAMIERLRRRWGLPVTPARHRRYWLTQAECQEEGQYTRLMPRLELDAPMAYQNLIGTPPMLFQELEQTLTPELQREMTCMRESLSPLLMLTVTLRHLARGDNFPIL